jgi:flagellar hook-associated protein 2
MGLTPLTFTGVSKYSADLQTILNRAVSIAALPAKAIQNQQTDLVQKKLITTNLETAVSGLSASLTALSVVGDNKGLTASSSNSSKVAILTSTGSTPASYTVSDITSVAKAASETSLVGYADPSATAVSVTGTLKLTIGSSDYTITLTPETNNLAGLRNAINNLDAGVTASVLTTGTGLTPNYLSVSANSTGEATLTITDDPSGAAAALLTSDNQGANAVFKLNGVAVSKSSNTINDVVPGVSFEILGTTNGDSVTVSLASDRGKLKSALQNVVSNYNAVTAQLDGQIGPTAGVLTGDFLIREIGAKLRDLVGFQGAGEIKNFSDLGLELSNTGELSLNTSTFDGLSDSEVSSAFTFAGSSANGLGSLSAKFTQLSDPISGLIKIQQDQYETTSSRLSDDLAGITDKVTLLQTILAQKLQFADSLLAQLESQQNVLTGSLQSLNFTSFGKQIT